MLEIFINTFYNYTMYELYPYFTNDGSVGLFSRSDDDIYHSTYGALSESWQKFILPGNLEQYLLNHEQVKILDICYGIGYNTKTALNVFLKNIFKFRGKNKKEFLKFNKQKSRIQNNYATIDTDNISENNGKNFSQNNQKNEENNFCTNILIDAVDIDNTLINLSPFIAEPSGFNFLVNKGYTIPLKNEIKYQQIEHIKKFKKNIRKDFKISKEVSIILFETLIKQNPEFFNSTILQIILAQKKYSPFLSRFMINFARFYHNSGCISSKSKNKSTFLHNIYYEHLSNSYKNTKNIPNDINIDINFHNIDARQFIKHTSNKYNFIYLDAFTPAKCPALWTVQFFAELYNSLEDDGMILTYSSSAAVRSAFVQNGFAVGKIYDVEFKKFIGTVAAKDKSLIRYPLDEFDIDLINSKAGICFNDENLNLDNTTIIENRKTEVKDSKLISSSKVLKGHNVK